MKKKKSPLDIYTYIYTHKNKKWVEDNNKTSANLETNYNEIVLNRSQQI